VLSITLSARLYLQRLTANVVNGDDTTNSIISQTVASNNCFIIGQQDAYRQTQGMQLKLCVTPIPLFKGNISVADCMALSSLL